MDFIEMKKAWQSDFADLFVKRFPTGELRYKMFYVTVELDDSRGRCWPLDLALSLSPGDFMERVISDLESLHEWEPIEGLRKYLD